MMNEQSYSQIGLFNLLAVRSLVRRIGKSMVVRSIKTGLLIRYSLLAGFRSLHQDRSGINLIGYFSFTSGVAEVGRFFARYLIDTGISFSIYDVEALAYRRLDENSSQAYLPYYSIQTKYHKNIFFINADQIPLIKETSKKLFTGRYNAAVFFWEFDDYFDFPLAFKAVQEVIAFTDFIATAVRKAAPDNIKVTKLPFPFMQNWTITSAPEKVRNDLGIDQDEYVFLFNFDFYSIYQRKNPEAILSAFEEAFCLTDKVRLILKTIHGEAGTKNYDSFQKSIEKMKLKSKLIVINENLDRNAFMSIINASDCYVSLHRSEGLGLGMLEAMSMAKPVIATNYGGNTDFMRSDNSLLVNYSLVPVMEGAEPYKAGWLWAEANVQEAASHMIKLYSDQHFSKKLGLQAQSSVQNQYTYEVFRKSLETWMNN